MAKSWKLIAIRNIEARLELLTGLHIGAGDIAMHIGGVDNPVIRHPLTGLPYIPGSSLKGKLRSLLEWTTGAIKSDRPLGLQERSEPGVEPILMLFGIGGGDASEDIGPGRLSIADAMLTKEFASPERNEPLTEVKFENSINRIQGTATNPRQTERVIAGTEFAFRANVRQFEGDPDLDHLLLRGLALLQLDALGGSGSRGYGKVRFRELTIDGVAKDLPQDPFAEAA